MDFGLKGRVAMVLGAGGGLGGAIVSALLDEGAHVAPCDLRPETVPEAITRRCSAIPLDLRDRSSVVRAVDTVEQRVGSVEILVNITGGPPPSKTSGLSPDVWTDQFHAMVGSVIALTDLVLPGMCRSGWGRIITSTSSGALSPIPMLGISNTLRGSLHTWSKSLAAEVAAQGITVNAVVPGRIATPRIAQLDEAKAAREGKTVEEVQRRSLEAIPAGRYGRTEEYGQTVAFLCSEQAGYITGSVVRVDGGMIPSV